MSYITVWYDFSSCSPTIKMCKFGISSYSQKHRLHVSLTTEKCKIITYYYHLIKAEPLFSRFDWFDHFCLFICFNCNIYITDHLKTQVLWTGCWYYMKWLPELITCKSACSSDFKTLFLCGVCPCTFSKAVILRTRSFF